MDITFFSSFFLRTAKGGRDLLVDLLKKRHTEQAAQDELQEASEDLQGG